MAKYKEKAPSRWGWKQILCAVLAIAAVVGCIGGVAAFAGNKTKTVSSLAFKIGALDEAGKYVENDQAIYTKEAFECIGLRVEPEFDADLTFDVYYYDNNGNLLEKKLGLDGVYDEDFPLAEMARVVIHPTIPEDVDKDDFKIGFFDVGKYASKVNITVDRNQDYLYKNLVNLYDEENIVADSSIASTTGVKNTVELTEYVGAKTTSMINVENGIDEYHVYVRAPYPPTAYINAAISDVEGNPLELEHFNLFDYYGSDSSKVCWIKLVIEVPDDESVDHLRVSMPSNAECYIYAID